MSSFWSSAVLVILSFTILNDADARDRNILEVGLDYVDKAVENFPKQIFTKPENTLSSIKYELYTRGNPKEACYIEPTPEKFDNCPFDPTYETKFLIPGFAVFLNPGNLFDDLKDALLNYKNYNIIYVDWTSYNNVPLTKVFENVVQVGRKAAELIHFMMNHTGVTPQQLHCIGHSFGSHVCGHMGRHVSNFSRITGLDPGGGINIVKVVKKDILLHYTDADFVDNVHTSFILTGLGLGYIRPLGDMDFYVNGGIFQKGCKIGRKYRVFAGDVLTVKTFIDQNLCDHFIPIEYFTNTVQGDCTFVGVKCSFLRAVVNPVLKLCPTNSSITAKMGFHSRKIPGLPPKSIFYVDTLEFPPYCKKRKRNKNTSV